MRVLNFYWSNSHVPVVVELYYCYLAVYYSVQKSHASVHESQTVTDVLSPETKSTYYIKLFNDINSLSNVKIEKQKYQI